MEPRNTESNAAPRYDGGRVTCYYIFVCLVAILGCALSGHLSTVPGALFMEEPFLDRFFPEVIKHKHELLHLDNQHNISKYCVFHSWSLAFYGVSSYITAFFSSTFVAPVVTIKYGPRVSMFCGAVCYLAGAVLQITAPLQYMLLLGRLAQGIGFGLLNQAVPIYVLEMSSTGHRGWSVAAVQLLTKLGAFLTNLIVLCKGGWKLSLSILSFPIAFILVFAAICFLPDTPHRLIQPPRNDVEEATKVLRRIRGTDDVMEEINAAIARAGAAPEMTCIQFIRLLQKKYVPALMAGILMPIFTQLTGVNMVSPVLFQAIGFSQEAALGIETFNCFVSLLSTSAMMYFVDNVDRKKFLITGGIVMLSSLYTLGVIEAKLGGVEGHTAHHALCFVMIILYVAGFGASWGPLGVLIPTEIYPSEIRQVGLGMSVAMSFVSSAVIGGSYPSLLCSLGHWIFFVLAGMVIFVTAYVCTCLPETGGILLEGMHSV